MADTAAPLASVPQTLDTLLAQALTQPAAYGAGVGTTGIDDESIGGSEFDFYKVGPKSKKDRLFFLTPKSIVHARAHYSEGNGFLLCMSEYRKQGDKEIMVKQAECCRRLPQARKRCAGLVLQYSTNTSGQMQKVDPLFALKVWRFNEKTFSQLRDMHQQFPLDKHDFNVTLDGDEKYQGVNLMPVAGDSVTAHPKFIETYSADILTWVTATQPQLERTVGRRLDAAKWAEILKTAVAAPAAGGAAAPAEEAGVQTLEELLS